MPGTLRDLAEAAVLDRLSGICDACEDLHYLAHVLRVTGCDRRLERVCLWRHAAGEQCRRCWDTLEAHFWQFCGPRPPWSRQDITFARGIFGGRR